MITENLPTDVLNVEKSTSKIFFTDHQLRRLNPSIHNDIRNKVIQSNTRGLCCELTHDEYSFVIQEIKEHYERNHDYGYANAVYTDVIIDIFSDFLTYVNQKCKDQDKIKSINTMIHRTLGSFDIMNPRDVFDYIREIRDRAPFTCQHMAFITNIISNMLISNGIISKMDAHDLNQMFSKERIRRVFPLISDPSMRNSIDCEKYKHIKSSAGRSFAFADNTGSIEIDEYNLTSTLKIGRHEFKKGERFILSLIAIIPNLFFLFENLANQDNVMIIGGIHVNMVNHKSIVIQEKNGAPIILGIQDYDLFADFLRSISRDDRYRTMIDDYVMNFGDI